MCLALDYRGGAGGDGGHAIRWRGEERGGGGGGERGGKGSSTAALSVHSLYQSIHGDQVLHGESNKGQASPGTTSTVAHCYE